MALRIPVAVTKILKRRSPSRKKFDAVSKHYKYRVRSTGGAFSSVLLCNGYVIKRDHQDYSRRVESDFGYIQKMRSNPKTKIHFPDTRVFGTIMVQERCDVNETLFNKYKRQIYALAAKLGIDDIHYCNVGWRTVKGEPVPVFIDVGIRCHPVTPRKRRSGKKLSWFLPEWELNAIRDAGW